MLTKTLKMKIVGVTTLKDQNKKILEVVADKKKSKKQGMRAGALYYSLRDDG